MNKINRLESKFVSKFGFKFSNSGKSSFKSLFVILVLLSTILASSNENLYETLDSKRLFNDHSQNTRILKGADLSVNAYPFKVTADMHPLMGFPEKLRHRLPKGFTGIPPVHPENTIDKDLRTVVLHEEQKEDRDRLRLEEMENIQNASSKKATRDWGKPLPHEGEKCNLLLLKMFKLQGRIWSRRKDDMRICKSVRLNCCTYLDELVILKLWNEYSKPHITEYVNKLMYNYKKIMLLHYRIANISITEIDFHMYKSETIFYERTICERKDEVAFLDFNKGVKANKKNLELYYKDDNTENPKLDILNKVIEDSLAKDVKKDFKASKKKKGGKRKRRRNKKDRLLEEVKGYHKWNERILTEVKQVIHQSKEGIKEVHEAVKDHIKSIKESNLKKSAIVQTPKPETITEANNKVAIVKDLEKEDRSLKSVSAQPITDGNPMNVLMQGLQKSLEQISSNPEIKQIINKTTRMKQKIEDEAMFKITRRNAEKDLDEARKAVETQKNEQGSTLKLSKSETLGLKNINWLKKKFQNSLKAPVKMIHEVFQKKRRKLKSIVNSIQKGLAEVHTQLEGRGLNEKNYERILKKFPKLSDFNLWVYNQVRKGKKNIEDMPEFIVYKENKMNSFLKKTKKTLEDMLIMEKDFLAKESKVPIDNDFLYKFMKTLNKSDLPKVELPFYPRRDRQLPKLPKVPLSKINCFSYPVRFPRKFLIFNPAKFEFCYKTVLKLRRFDAQQFSQYLYDVKNAILEVVYMKKNIYCDVCEQSKQQFFDLENEFIYYDIDFCKALIINFTEYIKWKNIILIEYLNQLFNYVKCFQTEAAVTVFPFTTYVTKQLRQVYFIRRCFATLDDSSFYKYCHFICKKFSYTGFDAFFVGTADFLQNIFALLISFLRKMKINIPKDLYKETLLGQGQYKKTKPMNDYHYAAHLADPRYNHYDKKNFRPEIPEYDRKLNLDSNPESQRNKHNHRFGSSSGTKIKSTNGLKGDINDRGISMIYDALESRTRDSKLHPVHGIVFQSIKKELKPGRSSDEDKEPLTVKEYPPSRNGRILSTEKISMDSGAHDSGQEDQIMDDIHIQHRILKKKKIPKKPFVKEAEESLSQSSKGKASVSTKSDEVKEIFPKVNVELEISDLRTLYIEGEGLNPLLTESESDFGIEIEELIPVHYKKISLESLQSGTLEVVVPIKNGDVTEFNEDIDMKFKVNTHKEVDSDLVAQLYEKREVQKQERLKKLTKDEKKENLAMINAGKAVDLDGEINDKYVETIGEVLNMPEIDHIF